MQAKIPEKLAYKIWAERDFKDSISTEDGTKVEVLDPGTVNDNSAGPDFFNSRIRIGNLTFNGDIEIDPHYSDWKNHGHHLDKRFNKVILHVVLSSKSHHPFVVNQSGRKIQSIAIDQFLNESLQKTLRKQLEEIPGYKIKMPCREVNQNVPKKVKEEWLAELGLIRFRKKTERYLKRLKELVYLKELNVNEPVVKYVYDEDKLTKEFTAKDFDDPEIWNQLIYEQFFEALGYTKNKEMMHKLAVSVPVSFLARYKNEKNFRGIIESILFNVSGILPEAEEVMDDDSSVYLRELVEAWDKIKNDYDGEKFEKESWHYFKMRPQNFPTIRISAGAMIAEKIIKENLFSSITNNIEKERDVKKIIAILRNDLILKSKGYWKDHYNFNKKIKNQIKYFLGLNRVDEIIINNLLPIVSLYFEINKKPEASKTLLNVYKNYFQRGTNKLVSDVSKVLEIEKESHKSIYYQGMIDLFRKYCIKEKCLECEIGKEAFPD